MSAVDYPAEGLPDEHEQFQQYNLNGDISVVFTVKDDIEYLPTFLESIRTLEAGEIVAVVSGDQNDLTYRYLDSQQDVVAHPIHCNRGEGRNLAIEYATKPYVLMVDADNKYDFTRIDFQSLKNDKLNAVWSVDSVHVWFLFAKKSVLINHRFKNIQEPDDFHYIKDHKALVVGKAERIGYALNTKSEQTKTARFRIFPDVIRWPMRMKSINLTDSELLKASLRTRNAPLQFAVTVCYLIMRPVYHYLNVKVVP